MNFDTKEEIEKLRERTEYEAYLLEAIYEILENPFVFKNDDIFIYNSTGSNLTYHALVKGGGVISDWRPKFRTIAAPLILTTAFKLLDMIIEWILKNNNNIEESNRFRDKINNLKKDIDFPELIQTRVWLKQRLISLYKKLVPLRNTVIHNRHFKTNDGNLLVSNPKSKIITEVEILEDDLRNISLVVISVLRCLEKTWNMDVIQEKRLRYALDRISTIHTLPELNQKELLVCSVRLFVPSGDTVKIDILKIKKEVDEESRGSEVIFNIRLIMIETDGSSANAYLIPWEDFWEKNTEITKKRSDLSKYEEALPPDIDIKQVAHEMGLLARGQRRGQRNDES